MTKNDTRGPKEQQNQDSPNFETKHKHILDRIPIPVTNAELEYVGWSKCGYVISMLLIMLPGFALFVLPWLYLGGVSWAGWTSLGCAAWIGLVVTVPCILGGGDKEW